MVSSVEQLDGKGELCCCQRQEVRLPIDDSEG